MKTHLLASIFFLLATVSISAQQKFEYGVGGALRFDNDTFLGLQGRAITGLSDQVGGSATFTFFLTDGSPWSVDLDVMYLNDILGEDAVIYPFAGLNLLDGLDNIGLNLGVHINFVINEYKAYLDPKLVLDNGDPVIVSFGIFF